jgi:hypothetical protein
MVHLVGWGDTPFTEALAHHGYLPMGTHAAEWVSRFELCGSAFPSSGVPTFTLATSVLFSLSAVLRTGT